MYLFLGFVYVLFLLSYFIEWRGGKIERVIVGNCKMCKYKLPNKIKQKLLYLGIMRRKIKRNGRMIEYMADLSKY
jgi:hypothetical protein